MKLKLGAGEMHAKFGIGRLNERFPITDLDDWMLLSQSAHKIKDHEGEEVEVIRISTDEAEIRIGGCREIINPSILEES
jgi:hypothetical protein